MSKVNKPAGKRTRVNLIHDVSLVMCRSLPNVKVVYEDAERPMTSAIMLEILFNAALEHRNWTFSITAPTAFDVYSGEEELASVALEWSRRVRESLPHLTADRIPSTRGRSNVFSHKEAAPILRKMREYVYPLTDDEIMASNTSNVPSQLSSLKYHAERTVERTSEAMSEAAVAFALDPAFKAQFLQYEATFGTAAKRDTAKAMAEQEQAAEKCATLVDMQQGAGTVHAVAALTTRGWFVKYNGATSKYHAEELPDQFSNVHALKLVDQGTVIPGMGVKVSVNTFVVVVAA